MASDHMDDPPRAVLWAWQREYDALVTLGLAPSPLTPSSQRSHHLVRLIAASAGGSDGGSDGGSSSEAAATAGAEEEESRPHYAPPWLALELCDRGNLNDFLAAIAASHASASASAARPVITAPKVLLSILRDVARGVLTMHLQGWAHLDLKDHNIFLCSAAPLAPLAPLAPPGVAAAAAVAALALDAQPVAKLGDFGSARRVITGDPSASASAEVSASEQPAPLPPMKTTVVATSGWAAPEVLNFAEILGSSSSSGEGGVEDFALSAEEADAAAAVGTAADVFSFGILIWSCLAASAASSARRSDSGSPHQGAWLGRVRSNPLAGLGADRCLAALRDGTRPHLPTDASAAAAAAAAAAEGGEGGGGGGGGGEGSLLPECDDLVKLLSDLATDCWATDPAARPSMLEVAATLDAAHFLCQ